MTIAICYLSPEGVVFGADSTSTFGGAGELHYFNHAQKIFEIGENSTLGIVTWGLGSLGSNSYRMFVAKLADSLEASPAHDLDEVASRWIDLIWSEYNSPPTKLGLDRCRVLATNAARTADEEREFNSLKNVLVVGFCLGGYVLPSRVSEARVAVFDPLGTKPTPQGMVSNIGAWGAPNMMQRLFFGFDDHLRQEIMSCGKWLGTPDELNQLFTKYMLTHPILPIRDAIDFVYSSVFSTVKAFKFSSLSQICGGPIEIAVVTSDRNFRWVRHKQWDSAITDGEP